MHPLRSGLSGMDTEFDLMRMKAIDTVMKKESMH